MRTLLQKFIPEKILNIYYWALEFLAALVYGFPSKKLYVIGVTGTNGKTTVVELIAHILEKADFKVASISSVQFKIGSKTWTNKLKMTMPSRLRLQGFFKKALGASCQYVVLETTSEGIKQYRHQFVDYNAAVFTNLTPEHIQSHGSFEKYQKAKGQLFKKLKQDIIKFLLGHREGITIIGPASIIKDIKKDPNKIQLLVLSSTKKSKNKRK